MTATIYGRGQMVIPAKARKAAGIQKGDVFAVEAEGPGKLVLVRLELPAASQYKLVRRKGKHSIIAGGPKITSEMVRKALADFP